MKIRMQVIDADYFLNNGKPVMRIFGKTEGGLAVCGMYDKLSPYFYVKAAEGLSESAEQQIAGIKEVRNIEWCEKYLPFGYQDRKTRLMKLTLTNPQDVPKVRDFVLRERIAQAAFEADILFKYRFMVDKCIKGMQWVEMDCEKEQKTVKSKVPIFRIYDIAPVECNENVQLKYLAFDIECIPSDMTKPIDAKRDPIVMISLSFRPAYRGKESMVFVAKPIIMDGVKGFSTEKEMLVEFLSMIDQFDPDIITGYNINSFDLPYLVERLRQNKSAATFGRSDKEVFARTAGMSQEFSVNGRIVADPYQILKRDPWVKFHRYDLKTVAKKLLQEDKHDVEYSEMPSLWNGDHAGLVKFIEYARKDADLSMKLLVDRGMLDKFFELSKISGLLLQDTFGGQTRRIETMLLHEFRSRGFVMPHTPGRRDLQSSAKERGEQGLKGATVLEPQKGLHADGCVLVLDFKSLYPSIMRTYNISPDTAVKEQNEGIPRHQSPSGAYFVDETFYKGIFPDMVTRLLEARSNAKKLMKEKTGEERRILNAKQLALKDMANSLYGYTGYMRARLYMIDVANSVTAYGRENLEKTRRLIEENFSDVKVIYADTDSAFVKTSLTSLDEAKELGEKISKFVTSNLSGVLELEFEKIYKPFLILTKKRYAGWRFDHSNGEWHDEIEMRGIETVRRDWCPLVSEIMVDVLNIILKEGDVQRAATLVKETLDKLKKGQIPMEKLTVIKGIAQSLDSYRGTLPHIELARKIASRNPQEPPRIGDRLGFVIVKGNMMLSKRAEDPAYAAKHNLPIDSDYYIESQLFPPIERIFSSMGIERSEIMGGGHQTTFAELFGSRSKKAKKAIANGSADSAASTSEQSTTILEGWEDFVCGKCNKSYRRMPLQGVCACGGQMLISWHGSSGNRVVMK